MFCELNAKMSSETLVITDFPDPTVEMRDARYRALTQNVKHFIFLLIRVEMRDARYRALTHTWCMFLLFLFCRNEGRPIQGIDTTRSQHHIRFQLPYVEMRDARYRALTPAHAAPPFKVSLVEMRDARHRALTHEKDATIVVVSFVCKRRMEQWQAAPSTS